MGPVTEADLKLISGYVGYEFREKCYTRRGKEYRILAAFRYGQCIRLCSMQKLSTLTFADFLRLLHGPKQGMDWGIRYELSRITKMHFPDPRAYE